MKRIVAIMLILVMVLAILTGCGMQNLSEITMVIAETLPSCAAFEYKDGQPYCFYAYDTEGKLYRILWTDFSRLNEKDLVVVQYNGDVKNLTYDESPSGWTPQYEVTATSVGSGSGVGHFKINSGDNSIRPFSCLLWSKIDKGNGRFTEAFIDKYDVVDLVSGKINFPIADIPKLVLDEHISYSIQVNGMVEKVYLITPNEDEYTKTETTFEALSDLADGTYYVVVEVLLDGNCDPDAPQNSYRYENVFCLVVGE